MDNNEIKQIRKIIFHQIKLSKERLETASFIIERKESVDAIPILFKALDIALRTLLNFRQKPLADFKKNIEAFEEEYTKEGLYDEETKKLFNSLYKMNEKYENEIELEYDEEIVKNIFEKMEDFLNKAYKFLRTQLTTSKERAFKKTAKRIFVATTIFIASMVVVFFLIKLGINLFGPKHGLLAHYYNNTNLKGPAVVERIDKKIDFRWGPLRPHPKITKKFFSIRWEGRIKINKNDKYTFYINSDEGFRFYIDDKIIKDTWLSKHRTMENSVNIKLKKGFHKIKLEYYFNQKFADIELLWSSSLFKKRLVGSKVLFPPLKLDVSK